MRATGTTWISRTDSIAASMLMKSLNAESGPQGLTSPLDQMNRFLRSALVRERSGSDSEGRLSSAMDPISVNPSARIGRSGGDITGSGVFASAPSGASSVVSPLVGIASTHQLLEAAMTLTLQGRSPALDGSEAISNWVNRVVTDSSVEPPARESGPAPGTLPPASPSPVDPGPDRSPDAIDGSSESGLGPADHSIGLDDSQVRWLVPIGAIDLWAETKGDAAGFALGGAEAGDA